MPFGVERVEVRFGIYSAVGTAYFDEVRLERMELLPWLNTRYGEPHDGLEVLPLQLGMFDAHHPLRNATHLRSAAPFLPSWEAKAPSTPFKGFSAVGVLRQTARWQPLVNALDRFGRLFRTAAAWLHHYAGPFAGGNWIFFGVDNADRCRNSLLSHVDLTRLLQFEQKVLLPLLKHLKRGIGLHGFHSKFACYRPNEAVEARISINNTSERQFDGTLTFTVTPVEASGKATLPQQTVRVEVLAGEKKVVTVRWDNARLPEGLYCITAQLRKGAALVDELQAGFVI